MRRLNNSLRNSYILSELISLKFGLISTMEESNLTCLFAISLKLGDQNMEGEKKVISRVSVRVCVHVCM